MVHEALGSTAIKKVAYEEGGKVLKYTEFFMMSHNIDKHFPAKCLFI